LKLFFGSFKGIHTKKNRPVALECECNLWDTAGGVISNLQD